MPAAVSMCPACAAGPGTSSPGSREPEQHYPGQQVPRRPSKPCKHRCRRTAPELFRRAMFLSFAGFWSAPWLSACCDPGSNKQGMA